MTAASFASAATRHTDKHTDRPSLTKCPAGVIMPLVFVIISEDWTSSNTTNTNYTDASASKASLVLCEQYSPAPIPNLSVLT